MKKEFADYLTSIGVPTASVERIDEIIALYADLMPEVEPLQIFVSEKVEQDGDRTFRSLFLFSEEYMLEAKSFMAEYNIDAVYLKESVDYIQVSLKDYEPGKASEKSRLTVVGYFVSEFDFDMRAVGANCEHLWQISKKLLLPNWVKLESSK